MSVFSAPAPEGAILSDEFKLRIGDIDVPVYSTGVADFASFSISEPVTLNIFSETPMEKPILRPVSRGIIPEGGGNTIRFSISRSQHLCLDLPGRKEFFIYINPAESNRPDADDPKVKFYSAGKIYDEGQIELADGETLYIEEGAVVRGCVHAAKADDVRICGRGILDGSVFTGAGNSRRMMVLEHCKKVLIEDVTLINPTSWMIVLGACEGVEIRNVKEIGECVCSDGIDIVGSSNVHIHGNCQRNNDDCAVVKAIDPSQWRPGNLDWRADVDSVLIEDCVFYNAHAGNAMEIGYETRTEKMSNITFRNIDVIGAHGEGGVFTIHAGDRACISDVLYEDIRVEHFYDKLVDFRIILSRYSKDDERGSVRNITLRNIRTIQDNFNTTSLIGGLDEKHTIEGVRFENLVMGDKRIMDADEMGLYLKRASGVTFE